MVQKYLVSFLKELMFFQLISKMYHIITQTSTLPSEKKKIEIIILKELIRQKDCSINNDGLGLRS